PSVSNWSDVAVYSPIDGTILDVEHEWAGTRVMIKSTDHPAYHFVLFHIDLDTTLTNGAAVSAGQLLGSHIGNETTSDIAVRISTVYSNQPMHRLISYFEVMTDGLFSNYVDRGVADLSDLIISQSERDSDPLICEGETFIGPTGSVYYVDGGFGNITNVFELSAP
ncbi:MAG: hypothetical protein OSB41_15595, partial [Kiritimatiellae bacterium]|nr:hypothetical protein [Kiritimatiellia bacterium]